MRTNGHCNMTRITELEHNVNRLWITNYKTRYKIHTVESSDTYNKTCNGSQLYSIRNVPLLACSTPVLFSFSKCTLEHYCFVPFCRLTELREPSWSAQAGRSTRHGPPLRMHMNRQLRILPICREILLGGFAQMSKAVTAQHSRGTNLAGKWVQGH